MKKSFQRQDQGGNLNINTTQFPRELPLAMMMGTVIGFRASSNNTSHNLLIRPAGRLSRSNSRTIGTSSSARVSSFIFSETSASTNSETGGGACFLYNCHQHRVQTPRPGSLRGMTCLALCRRTSSFSVVTNL
jgi:hypothetical protein